MRSFLSFVASAFVSSLALASACSSSSSSPGQTATSDASSPVDAGSDGAATMGCPTAAPTSGEACGPQGIVCEYGGANVVVCDTVATCNGGRWELTAATKSDCVGTSDPICPTAMSAVPIGHHCDMLGATCDYPTGRCACTVRESPTVYDASAQATWICPSPNGGCPLPRPMLGTACSGTTECDYGTCAIPNATAQACTNGIWVQQNTACAQ